MFEWLEFFFPHFVGTDCKSALSTVEHIRAVGLTNPVLITLWAQIANLRYRPLNISERSGF